MNTEAISKLSAATNEMARSLQTSFSSFIAGDPEDQLKAPVQKLLTDGARELGFNVIARTESRVQDLSARPDIGVGVDGLLAGYVELKAPGKGARPERFRTGDAAQWRKFQSLPNLIYTDANEWSLFRYGERIHRVVRFSGDLTADGEAAVGSDVLRQLERLLTDFFMWQPTAPSTPKALAELLAPLCRLLRDDVTAAVQRPDSALELLVREWRTYLFPEADDRQFADAYAQTLTYALLLAKFEGAANLRTEAADSLDQKHGLLAQVLRVLAQPEARKEIELPISLLERMISVIDPAALSSREDPWLYFYEDFLAAYDEALRRRRGVYYTPAEVVKFQVRLVGELLHDRFGKALTFADDDVTLLDPAVGTGAYPLAAIQHGLDRVRDEYGSGAVGSRATTAAQNVHAFELLVGPYSVAHLRLTQQILDAGGALPQDGVHVYLTDTLDSPFAVPSGQQMFDLMHRRLSEEASRARTIKADKRLLVCIGNPPYFRQLLELDEAGTERQGGWIRFGDHGDDGILEDFIKPVTDAGNGLHLKNLYNLYVYFWRWALWKVFESTHGSGIVSFITASSYLRGPGFAGMRQVMRETFDELWVVDLEGHARAPRKTENVFAIANPVAIAIGIRRGGPKSSSPAVVRYAKITGSRAEKLAKLDSVFSFADLTWQDCYTEPQAPFLPRGAGDYFSWPLLTDLFPWQYSGVQFKRSWPIAPTQELLRRRWQELANARPSDRPNLLRETTARRASRASKDILDPGKTLPSISSIAAGVEPAKIRRYGFRSLDRQWVLLDKRLCDRPRDILWQIHSDKQLFLTSLLTEVLGLGPAATVSANVPDLHHFCNFNGAKHAVPLWRDRGATEPNVTPRLLDVLRDALRIDVGPVELFSYCTAILSAPEYVVRFNDELTEPGPRIPLTKNPTLFQRAVEIGRRIAWLYSFGETKVAGAPRGPLPRGMSRCTKTVSSDESMYPDEFRYNESSRTLHVGDGEFGPVAPEVWGFSISGFEVVQSWLGRRMADRSGRSSSPLDELRPARWSSELTEELLRVLWITEELIGISPELNAILDEVASSELIMSESLPMPGPTDREAPGYEGEEPVQLGLGLGI